MITKGSRFFHLHFIRSERAVVSAKIAHIEVVTMGSKQGTAVLVDSSDFSERRIYHTGLFFSTREEAMAYIDSRWQKLATEEKANEIARLQRAVDFANRKCCNKAASEAGAREIASVEAWVPTLQVEEI